MVASECDAFHTTRLVVARARHAPAQLLLLGKLFALHSHLVGRLGGPLHQLGIGAVVGVVFVEYGPARHPGLGREIFKRRANHGQRAYNVLAHTAQNDASVVVLFCH
jgi:hypothetical protein